MTVVQMRKTNTSSNRSVLSLFSNSQIDISNILPSMQEQVFLRDVEEIAEDLGIDKKMLKAKMAELLKKKNYIIRVMSILEQQVVNKSRRKINFIPMTRENVDLDNPFLKSAFDRLMSKKGEIEYQKAKGGAAKSVHVWVKENLIDTGVLSIEEVSVMPMWMFQRFDPRLATAFHNAKRYAAHRA